jgi:hypothetical protein
MGRNVITHGRASRKKNGDDDRLPSCPWTEFVARASEPGKITAELTHTLIEPEAASRILLGRVIKNSVLQVSRELFA